MITSVERRRVMPRDPNQTDSSREREERRAFEHGSSGATADFATDGRPRREDASVEGPYARPATPLAPGEVPDQLAEKKRACAEGETQALLDEASEESFPASDPPSPSRGRG
jgi:hypothetical protein